MAKFDTGDPAAGAVVRVYRPNGELLLPAGTCDSQGVYVFSFQEMEELKVTVSDQGHLRNKYVPVSALAGTPLPDPEPRSRLTEILAGLSFILALAAFILSIRTAARLKQLMTLPSPALTPADPLPSQEAPTGPRPH